MDENWSARGPIIVGAVTIVVLVGGLAAWSLYARLAGAVVLNITWFAFTLVQGKRRFGNGLRLSPRS